MPNRDDQKRVSTKRTAWRLHRSTWGAACLVLIAGSYLNINVADFLYRVKYGPVRPSLLVSGWPIDSVEEDAVSSALRLDRTLLLADVVLCLIIALGTAVKVEQWRRKHKSALTLSSEHVIGLLALAAVVTALEVISRSDSLIDPIDYVGVFRWPSQAVMFFGLWLTCMVFVDVLGVAAKQVTQWLFIPGHG